VVNQHRQFCFRLVPRQPGAFDPLKHLGCRQAGSPLRRTRRFRWRWCCQPGWEAISLAADNVILPAPGRSDADDWGELHIRGATPDAGSEWTDNGSPRERRQLKHRAEGDSRIVPPTPS
jgi:hypothetical protein